MLSFLRNWLIGHEVAALAKMKDFSKADPERVNRVLHSFAVLRLSAPNHDKCDADTNKFDPGQSNLIRIWELSREQYQKDRFRRAQWHRVMANCNSLYEQFSKGSSAKPSVPVLAQASS